MENNDNSNNTEKNFSCEEFLNDGDFWSPGIAEKLADSVDITEHGLTDTHWEDIKFVTSHAHDFQRIAVITQDQWLSWASWINGAFTDAEIDIFTDHDEAMSWMEADMVD